MIGQKINYWAKQNEAPTDATPAFLRKTQEIDEKQARQKKYEYHKECEEELE